MRDSLAFFLGYVVSLLVATGVYMFVVWDSLYPSLCNLFWGDVLLTAFGCAIPAMFTMLVNVIIKD